ncbi:MAG TPA: hypothetical protein VG106_11510, partial [Vicinamibacterales bacterium]|nr:hypothetical protein [Vicinamibacterales bacterium]
FYSVAGHVPVLRQLVQDVKRDIEFPDGSECLRNPAELSPGFRRLCALHARGQDGDGFPQPPRCHPGLMDTMVTPCHGLRQVPVERTRPSEQ